MSAFVQDDERQEQAVTAPDAIISEPPEACHRLGETPGETPGDEPLASDLAEIAARIKGRDVESASCSRRTAIDNGLDLLTVKRIVGHGKFERWCRDHLSYSKSKAEKLMRLGKEFGPVTKSVGCTDLPPLDLLHDLVALATPEPVRDAFIPRLRRGEDVEAELRAVLKKLRDERARKKREGVARAASEPAVVGDQSGDEAQTEAYARALGMLGDCLASELPQFLELLQAATPGRILTPGATCTLEELARRQAGSGTPEKGGIAPQQVSFGRPVGSVARAH